MGVGGGGGQVAPGGPTRLGAGGGGRRRLGLVQLDGDIARQVRGAPATLPPLGVKELTGVIAALGQARPVQSGVRLEEVQSLFLQKNPMTYLPLALCNLTKLSMIVVSGERMVKMPTAICSSPSIKFIKLFDKHCEDEKKQTESMKDHGSEKELEKEFIQAYVETLRDRGKLAQVLKTEKHMLEEKLHRTEDDLSKRLSITQQTLAEKTKELDRLRNEWSSHASLLTNRHTQDVTAERDKSLQIQSQCQIKYEQQKREMEMAHSRAVQHLESRVTELESTNKELTERKYKSDSAIRELKAKLTGLEEDYHRAKQEVISLRRENSTLDSECHEKEKLLNQLRTRTAVLEQEVKDKEQVVTRTTDEFETAKEHKKKLEESVEHKQLLIGNFEATVKSLSEELLKAVTAISLLCSKLDSSYPFNQNWILASIAHADLQKISAFYSWANAAE
ncbi:UNVERIFIED_CONTAM: hypothetical protein FKN15_050738 [Acipenser sinensis]